MKLRGASANDCRVIDAALDLHFETFESGLSMPARQHLSKCERCRRLYGWVTEPDAISAGSTNLASNVQNAVFRNLTPVTPLPATRVLAVQLLGAIALFALLMIAAFGFAGLQYMRLPQVIGMTSVFGLGATALSFSLAWQMIPGSLHRFSVGVIVALLPLCFSACVAMLFRWQPTHAFVIQGWPCLAVGASIAVPAALFLWFLLRRGVFLSVERLGCALAAISGLVGATVAQFRCSRQEASHLLVWHGGVLVIVPLAGLLVADLYARFRSSRP